MSSKVKTYCYKSKCGPVVKTGAVLSVWLVCKECKEEVSEKLAEDINNKLPHEAPSHHTNNDDEGYLGINAWDQVNLFGSDT